VRAADDVPLATDPELADWIIRLSADLRPEQLAEAVRPRLAAVLAS